MSWLSQGLHHAADFFSTLTIKQTSELAPIVTASMALTAATIAFFAIRAQKDIARRRAAIDFFLKTELDVDTVKLYKLFRDTSPQFAAWATRPDFMAQEGYHRVRAFLNVCELIAVGIRHKAFSNKVSFAYWGDVLPDSYRKAKVLIEAIRQTPGEGTKHTYSDLEWLCKKWS